MHVRRTRILFTAAAAALALSASACSDTASISSSTAAETTGPTDTATVATAEAITTLAPTTTASPASVPDTSPPATTPAPTPTVAAPAPLVLRDTGVGSYEFGMSYVEVAAGLGSRLEALTDVASAYPTSDGFGSFISADGSQIFSAPFGREACWSDGATRSDNLCLSFGGPSASSLSFVGWHYGGRSLLTGGGLTGGSRWSDFPEIFAAGTAGCYNTSGFSVGDILLSLESTGALFGSYDESGVFIGPDPAPADVRITWMTAGSTAGSTEGDC